MNKFKKSMKTFWAYVWDFFKGSFPSLMMYCCAGTVLMMLTFKGNPPKWDNTKLVWTVVVIVAAVAYNALLSYAQGGNAYEMLVSGNMKRYSANDLDGGYKISSHKYVKEYRPWKGFTIGAVMAFWTILTAIIFGANQTAIDNALLSDGKLPTSLGVVMIICFLISGWSILPLYYMNAKGMAVNYFLSGLFAILPIVVTGLMYIAGAYGRRAKTIKAQQLADRQREREEKREKKINYGGLPGTKPRKRK